MLLHNHNIPETSNPDPDDAIEVLMIKEHQPAIISKDIVGMELCVLSTATSQTAKE